MITGLKVHTKSGLLELNAAHENSSTSELLADVVTATQTGNPANWSLREGSVSGRVLDPDLTLRQNHVGNNQILYLVSSKVPVDQELNLEIAAQDGQTLHFEVRSSTLVSLLLAEVPAHFGLKSVDAKGKPVHWRLVQERTGKQLESEQSLGENGISRHDRLSLEQEAAIPDLAIEGVAPDGQVWKRDVPPHNSVAQLRDELLTHFELPKTSYAGDLIEWSLRGDKDNRKLDLEKTLAENAIETGDRLLLETRAGDCLVVTVSSSGTPQQRRFAVAGDTPTAALVQTLVKTLKLAERANDGRPHVWHLTDDRGNTLVQEQTLAANGVNTGDNLSLVLAVPDLRLEVFAPSYDPFESVEPETYLTGELLRQLVWKLQLKAQDEHGRKQEWQLRRKGGETPLDPSKSLSANGLSDGDTLELVPVRTHIALERVIDKEKDVAESFLKRLTGSTWLWPLALLLLAGLGLAVFVASRKHLPVLTLEISPVPTTPLSPGQKVTFHSRSSSGESVNARWSINPAEFGKLKQDGQYTAPSDLSAPRTVTLTATRVDDPSVSSSTTLSLLPKEPPPVSGTIPSESNPNTTDTSIHPDTTNTQIAPMERIVPQAAAVGSGQQLKMVLRPLVNDPVRWSVSPALGSITGNGEYTAPATVTKTTPILVTATSPSTGWTATARITLQPVTVGPISVSSIEGHQYTLHAPVSNSRNTALTWSIRPPFGSISQEGVYTAPGDTTSAQTVEVIATSAADPAQSSHFELHLPANVRLSGPKVVINPHPSILSAGQREQFSATVSGTSNTSVTWSSSGLGNISPGGIFTAPALIPAAGATVHIYATSNADKRQLASTDITLRPSIVPQGPRSGVVTWQGKAGKNQTITIGNGLPGTIGSFPGVAIEVSIADKNVQIISAPSAAPGNGWKSVVVQTRRTVQTIQVNWKTVEGH